MRRNDLVASAVFALAGAGWLVYKAEYLRLVIPAETKALLLLSGLALLVASVLFLLRDRRERVGGSLHSGRSRWFGRCWSRLSRVGLRSSPSWRRSYSPSSPKQRRLRRRRRMLRTSGHAIDKTTSLRSESDPYTYAFGVETQPVPESATMAALGVGAVAMLRRRRQTGR
jgi:hypothetical protein